MVYLEISETRKPTYDLEAFKAAAHRIRITAAALGFRRAEIVAIIQTIQRPQFYKSMTSYGDHRIWQDVYHVPTEAGMLYMKFTSDAVTYKGRSITVDMPGWYGDRPDDGLFDAEDMKISDRALNRLKARTEGLLEPEEIKRIRKKIGLTQEAAGQLIGGGPRAFQRYESGDLLPSRAMSSALVLLDHNPAALSVLTARQVANSALLLDEPG